MTDKFKFCPYGNECPNEQQIKQLKEDKRLLIHELHSTETQFGNEIKSLKSQNEKLQKDFSALIKTVLEIEDGKLNPLYIDELKSILKEVEKNG